MRLSSLCACLLVWGLLPAAHAQISVSPASPVVGETVTLNFTEPVDTLRVTYRPGSNAARTEALPVGSPAYAWTPNQAGVVRLEAAGTSQNVSVRFRSVPPAGLLILVLAGTILFGGALFAFKKLFEA